jgi:HAD superfamily hydrolase (TIGR01459 family)
MTPPILDGARSLLARYDVLFCDVWGVLHDGNRAFDAANHTLTRYRQGGGTVILLSNAPMRPDAVATLLDRKAVARTAWDAVVPSGEIALAHIRAEGYRAIHRIGPAWRDRSFFGALTVPDTPLDQADAIACTGLVDDRHETADDYRAPLVAAAARNVPFVCANPDLAVHVGDDLLPCAGAIARVYEDLGGPVFWTGKPHASAYRAAFAEAARVRGAPVEARRVLAIGDSLRTDLAGAAAAGIDALFIASGLERERVMHESGIDPAKLATLFSGDAPPAIAALARLAW